MRDQHEWQEIQQESVSILDKKNNLNVNTISNSPDPTVHLSEWIRQLLGFDQMLQMGHLQRREDMNLGMGWLYYAFARLIRPARIVVIGSWRGFVPLILGKATSDNSEPCKVTFIDPSFIDDHWEDAVRVKSHFSRFNVENVEHFKMTTQEFVNTPEYESLGEIGILFIDGLHTKEQAKFDFEAFASSVPSQGIILLHDSVVTKSSAIYGEDKRYTYDVNKFIGELKACEAWQVLDLPFWNGLTLVRPELVPIS